MSARVAVLALALCVVAAVPAAAQAARPATAGGPKHEISIGGVFSGPSSMGTANAELLGSIGRSFQR